MSREILFKAKSEFRWNSWVFGNLVVLSHSDNTTMATLINKQVCIAETVSQFTGFEKNGVKIFENDVLKTWIEDKQEQEGGFFHHTIAKMINGCWSDCGIGYDYELNDDEPLTLHTVMNDDFEVVGSIFDHPELMKDGKY